MNVHYASFIADETKKNHKVLRYQVTFEKYPSVIRKSWTAIVYSKEGTAVAQYGTNREPTLRNARYFINRYKKDTKD